ncbi:MAG: hemerythrin domain-containing protein [Alphaproteobacteria bacterium]
MKPILIPESLKIGHELIDSQHQRIVDHIVSLGARNGAALRPDLDARLGELRDLEREHFRAEERIMRSAGFDGLAEHITHHENCLSLLDGKIARILENSAISEQDLSDLLALFLEDVFKVDLKFQEFLVGQK